MKVLGLLTRPAHFIVGSISAFAVLVFILVYDVDIVVRNLAMPDELISSGYQDQYLSRTALNAVLAFAAENSATGPFSESPFMEESDGKCIVREPFVDASIGNPIDDLSRIVRNRVWIVDEREGWSVMSVATSAAIQLRRMMGFGTIEVLPSISKQNSGYLIQLDVIGKSGESKQITRSVDEVESLRSEMTGLFVTAFAPDIAIRAGDLWFKRSYEEYIEIAELLELSEIVKFRIGFLRVATHLSGISTRSILSGTDLIEIAGLAKRLSDQEAALFGGKPNILVDLTLSMAVSAVPEGYRDWMPLGEDLGDFLAAHEARDPSVDAGESVANLRRQITDVWEVEGRDSILAKTSQLVEMTNYERVVLSTALNSLGLSLEAEEAISGIRESHPIFAALIGNVAISAEIARIELIGSSGRDMKWRSAVRSLRETMILVGSAGQSDTREIFYIKVAPKLFSVGDFETLTSILTELEDFGSRCGVYLFAQSAFSGLDSRISVGEDLDVDAFEFQGRVLAALERIKFKSSTDSSLNAMIGFGYTRLGEFDKAVDLMRLVSDSRESKALSLINEARVEIARGNFADALLLAKESRRLEDTNVATIVILVALASEETASEFLNALIYFDAFLLELGGTVGAQLHVFADSIFCSADPDVRDSYALMGYSLPSIPPTEHCDPVVEVKVVKDDAEALD